MRLSVVCLIVGCAVLSAAQPTTRIEEQQWNHFKTSFGKTYGSADEEELRKTIFLKNARQIEEHNQLYEQGRVSFTLKMNKYGDLSPAEFRRQMNGYRLQPRNPEHEVYSDEQTDSLPASVDWRTKGAVTPIKDQAQCGSCWAFSATGSLEGQHFLKTGKLVSLSEQNIMDCSWAEGNEGCNGGWMDQAFEYVEKNKGVDTEQSYPYEAEDGSCRFKKANVGATVSNITDVKAKSEAALQSAVATIGPISVAIDAGEFSFQFYGSGVYYEKQCDPDMLDHGVLAVGYGSSNGKDYWIVKNSWGDSWGDNGYILMSRNKNNNCGIATKASFPIV